MTILLAAPRIVAAPTRTALLTPLTLTWEGYDGSKWNLTDPAEGVFLLPGVRGLNAPQHDRYTSESPGVAGSRHRGRRTLEREVFLPLHVYADASQDWIDRDRALWRTFHPDRTGWLRAQQPSGEVRSLALRFVTDGGHSTAMDPVAAGWDSYGVTMVAEQPFWEGEPVTRSFATSASSSFFGAGAPSFFISSGSTLGSATIANPGDEQAWPVWTLHGPFTSATVGLDGRDIEVPFALAAGQSLTIDTRPAAQTAIDGTGLERTASLGAVQFAPVPPGDVVPLELPMVGTGSVEVALTPLFWRAW